VIFAVTVKVGQSLGGYLNASALPASFAGILATMLIARQLAGRWRVRWLTALGAAWMPVYLLHYLVTAAVWNGLLAAFVTSPPAQFVLGAIAGLVIPVGIYRLTRRLRIAAPAGFDLVDLAQRTEARQVELAHYRARIGIE
jgi:fucose 4-O-acetylase-like acetyltransferase